MTALPVVVLLIALQRLSEVVISSRNVRRLRAEGAVEHGGGHYPVLIAFHAAFLAAILLSVPWNTQPSWPLLGALVLCQIGRAWVMHSLGRFWTTRIMTLPGVPLVRSGPYRWLRHPNYAIVAAEVALLPLAFGAWALAIVFSALNAALLWHRIWVEDRALEAQRGIGAGAADGGRPRRGA